MAALKRNPGTWILILLLGAGFFLLRENRSSGAPPPPPTGVCPDCNFSTTDTIDGSNSITCTAPGCTLTYPGNLHMLSGGKITCPDSGASTNSGCDITLIVFGNLTMDAGSQINADNLVNGGHGGTISIKVCGDVTMQGTTGGTAGAIISSQHLGSGTDNGGQITVVAGCVTFDVDGNPVCGQPLGNISVGTGAKITANSNTHRGGDIALYAGRNILIQGSVTSQGTGGTGHGGLITIDACCDLTVDDTGLVSSKGLDPGADRVHLQGCTVEIFGLVESTGPGHQGPSPNCTPPIRPDRDPASSACVEIWSGTTLLIDATNGHHGQVNADVGQSGGTSGRGWIDAIANLDITINGNTTTPYNNGTPLPTGNLLDNSKTTPPWALHSNMVLQNGFGGAVAVLSKSGNVTTSGRVIQVNASTGSNGGTGGQVLMQSNGNMTLGLSSIQAMGDTTGGAPAGGAIRIDAFNNGSLTGGPSPGQLDAAGPGGTVKLFDCNGFVYTGDTVPGVVGPPSTDPVACAGPVEVPAPANGPTFPSGNCSTNCQPITFTPTPTPTPTAPLTHTATPTPGGGCNKSEVIGALAGHVPDVVVRLDLNNLTIQQAVTGATDSNNDGFIIVLVVKDGTGALGGSTHQSVIIDQVYPKPFQLFGCSVTMIDDTPHDANPTGWIKTTASSPANIFVMDLHGTGSDVAGWKVDGDGRTLRNVEGDTSGVGIWFAGNNNTMHNGKALSNNGVGVLVSGNANVVTDTLVEFNHGNGIEVHGDNNQILKTQLGDIGKGNTGDGLNVASGTGNLLRENTSRANTLDGFHVLTPGNTLTKNISGGTAAQDNGPCEYDVVAGNTNGGGNKAHGVLIPASAQFPPGCTP